MLRQFDLNGLVGQGRAVIEASECDSAAKIFARAATLHKDEPSHIYTIYMGFFSALNQLIRTDTSSLYGENHSLPEKRRILMIFDCLNNASLQQVSVNSRMRNETNILFGLILNRQEIIVLLF